MDTWSIKNDDNDHQKHAHQIITTSPSPDDDDGHHLSSSLYGTIATHIVEGDLGLGPGIGCQPQEDPVQAPDAQLECADRQRESRRPPRGLERELVGDVVVVVTEVPKEEVRDEGNVDSGEARASPAAHDAIVIGGGGGGGGDRDGRGGRGGGQGRGRRRRLLRGGVDERRGGSGGAGRADGTQGVGRSEARGRGCQCQGEGDAVELHFQVDSWVIADDDVVGVWYRRYNIPSTRVSQERIFFGG